MFEEATGTKLLHVPYKGGAPAAVAVASGDVPVGFNAMAGAVPLVKAGRIQVLGVATSQRIASEPTWPTLSEQGVPNFEYTVWTGLFAQKGVPADIVRKLDADFRASLADPDVAKKFAAFGAIPANENLKAFVERIKRDTRRERSDRPQGRSPGLTNSVGMGGDGGESYARLGRCNGSTTRKHPPSVSS